MVSIMYMVTCCKRAATHIICMQVINGFSWLMLVSLLFCIVFCRSLFVLLSSFGWSLYCVALDLQILIILTFWYFQTFIMQRHSIIAFRE
jgi:hypothetical protein